MHWLLKAIVDPFDGLQLRANHGTELMRRQLNQIHAVPAIAHVCWIETILAISPIRTKTRLRVCTWMQRCSNSLAYYFLVLLWWYIGVPRAKAQAIPIFMPKILGLRPRRRLASAVGRVGPIRTAFSNWRWSRTSNTGSGYWTQSLWKERVGVSVSCEFKTPRTRVNKEKLRNLVARFRWLGNDWLLSFSPEPTRHSKKGHRLSPAHNLYFVGKILGIHGCLWSIVLIYVTVWCTALLCMLRALAMASMGVSGTVAWRLHTWDNFKHCIKYCVVLYSNWTLLEFTNRCKFFDCK